jgi:hypothetical protein
LESAGCDAWGRYIGGWGRNRTGVNGVADRCMTTLPPSLTMQIIA